MATATAAKVIQQIRKLAAAEDRSHQTDRQLLERFVDRQEESAFHALVRRHGPLVLGVCRRVLRHEQDAEDAFQATFLILARKAASIGKKDSLSGWLYKVAYHAAIKARTRLRVTPRTPRLDSEPRSARSDAELRESIHSVSRDPLDELTARELLAVLDEEMQRLPERLRVPLVHCYLQGQTRDQAARQLGWSLSTLQRRLEQGRERLRGRLERRGVALSMGLLVAGVTQSASATGLPSVLASTTVKAAMLITAGQIAAGAVSAPALALANGVLKSLFTAKLKIATVALLAAGLIGVTVRAITQQVQAERQGAEKPSPRWVAGAESSKPRQLAQVGPASRRSKSSTGETPVPPALGQEKERPDEKQVTITGRVVGADGKPVTGASVAVLARARRQYRSGDEQAEHAELLGEAKADADGKFQLTIARTSSARFWEVYALVAAKGHGLGWQRLSPDAERAEVVLQLPPEQVVHARLLDVQGQPAARVTVSFLLVGTMVNGDWQGAPLDRLPKRPPWPQPVTTDDKGRFEVRGFNRDRGIELRVSDERFASESFELASPGKPRPSQEVLGIDVGGNLRKSGRGADEKGEQVEPTFTLTPAQILEGRVVYEDTGKPAAKARLVGGVMDATADADGRFRLKVSAETMVGIAAQAPMVGLAVHAPEGEPYLNVTQTVPWPKGAVKHTVEIKLPRGVLVRGKVTEAGSGKPVAGAAVQFWPADGSANRLPNVISDWQTRELTKADGTFQIPAMRGVPGHLFVQGPTPDYVHQVIDSEVVRTGRAGGGRLYPDAFVKLDPPLKGELKEKVVNLKRGVTVRGRLLGPDGEPVAKAVMLNPLHVFIDMSWHQFPPEARDGWFEVHGLDAEKTYSVYFLDAEHQRGAAVQLSGKQAGQEVTVRLAPCGKATARYVDGAGKPLAKFSASPDIVITPGRFAHMGIIFVREGDSNEWCADEASLTNIDRHNYWDKVQTDAHGRVTFPALIPGAVYRVGRFDKNRWRLHKEFTVESGKTVDLGDIPINNLPER